jgi:hypothetical protein
MMFRRKPHPKSDFIKTAVATILADLTPAQMEAVNVWCWATARGWNAPTEDIALYPEKYPHLNKVIKQ